MSIPEPILLDATKGCHPILPLRPLVDVIRFSALAPVKDFVNGAEADVEIPLLTAFPDLLANVHAGSVTEKEKLISMFGGNALLSKDYQVTPQSLSTRAIPNVVTVGNLNNLIQQRSISVQGRNRAIDLTKQSLVALSYGRSAVVRLSGTEQEIELQPDMPLANGSYTVLLDAQGEDKLLQSGMVSVAGYGEKQVKLTQGLLASFVQTGQAEAGFSGNRNAKLTLVRDAWGASSPRIEVMRQAAAGAMFGEKAPINVADRYKLVMATRSSPLMIADPNSPGSADPMRVTPVPPQPRPSSGGGVIGPEPAKKLQVYVYLPFRQEWTLKGYSRGALLNVISLAPQEEATIEVFSWQRLKAQAERSNSFEGELSLEAGVTNKDSVEVVDEARRENGWRFDVNGGVSAGKVPVQLNVGGGYTDKLNKTVKQTSQKINESTVKASSKIKTTRQTKVTESTETGSETRVTRRLRNPNLGHTLNLDCFEVLANYQVGVSLQGEEVRLGVAVPMTDLLEPMLAAVKPPSPQGNVDIPSGLVAVLAYEHVISPRVPPDLRAGFAGAKLLLTNHRICRYKCAPRCVCEDGGSTDGGTNATTSTPESAAIERLMGAAVEVKRSIDALASADTLKHVRLVEKAILDTLRVKAPPSQQEWESVRRETRQYLYRRMILEGPVSRFWSVAVDVASYPWTEASIRKLIGARAVHATDALNVALLVAQRGPRLASEAAGLLLRAAGAVADLSLSGTWGLDDAGLDSALNQMAQILGELDAIRKPLTPPPSGGGASDEGAGSDPLEKLGEQVEFTDKELAEATVNLEVLIRHISDNASYFRALLWHSISPEDRAGFVQGFGDVQKLVSGQILGTVGTSVVFELTADAPGVAQFLTKLNIGNMVEESVSRTDVELPTPAVTLEARLGTCEALEPFLKGSRAAELERVQAVAKQQVQESRRMEKRIDKDKLDDPKPAGSMLIVERTPGPP